MPREHLALNTHHEGQGTLIGYELVDYEYQKQLVNIHHPPGGEGQDWS